MSTSLPAKRTSIPLIPLPPLLLLPKEILEEVVSILSSTTDLLSLALTCSPLTAFIIPRHTEYRIIRVRTLNPTLFAHLARRADLARNVREVHVCERHNYTSGDRVPTKLVAMEKDMEVDYGIEFNGVEGTGESAAEERKVANVCRALKHMKDLRVFTWSWNVREQPGMGIGAMGRPTLLPRHEDAILTQVVNKPTLQHFGISGAFGMHASGLSLDKNSMVYPVWQLNNLTSLCLLGDAWVKSNNTLFLSLMVARCPNLEYLEVPLDCPALPSLHFPALKYLKMLLQSGATPAIDAACATFLEKHPTIEELSWYPIGGFGGAVGMPALKEGILPNLRRLRGSVGVVEALAASACPGAQAEAVCRNLTASTLPVIKESDSEDDMQTDSEIGTEVAETNSVPISPSRPRFDPSYSPPPQSPIPLCAPPSTPTYAPVGHIYSQASGCNSFDNSSEQQQERRFCIPDIGLASTYTYEPGSSSWSAYPPRVVCRPIESLDIRSLRPSKLLELYGCSCYSPNFCSPAPSTASYGAPIHSQCSSPPSFSRLHLRHLALHILPTRAELVKIAEVFPNIQWLSLPSPPVHPQPQNPPSIMNSKARATLDAQSRLTLNDVFDVLPLFTNLEIFRGPMLWALVVLDSPSASIVGSKKKLSKEQAKQEMHQVILEMVARCPKLREVDHCDFYEKRFAFKRVVIERLVVTTPVEYRKVESEQGAWEEEETMEAVGYCVKRPRMRDCFDVLDGAFN